MGKKKHGIDFEPETVVEEYAILIGRIEALNALMEINEQRFYIISKSLFIDLEIM